MKPKRILFIGNSFTNRNDMPATLEMLARAAIPSRSVATERIIANGMSLKAHWNRGAARQAMADSRFDFVVLQEQSTLPLKNPSRMHESIALFDEEIKASGAITVLYLTWARRHEFERQDQLSRAYLSIGQKLGALIAPVGVAWQRALGAQPGLVLHDKDNSHPNPAGSYLAACVFFATLFRKSLVGLPGATGLDPEILPVLQHAAWDIRINAAQVMQPPKF